jgi:hypothetical protein
VRCNATNRQVVNPCCKLSHTHSGSRRIPRSTLRTAEGEKRSIGSTDQICALPTEQLPRVTRSSSGRLCLIVAGSFTPLCYANRRLSSAGVFAFCCCFPHAGLVHHGLLWWAMLAWLHVLEFFMLLSTLLHLHPAECSHTSSGCCTSGHCPIHLDKSCPPKFIFHTPTLCSAISQVLRARGARMPSTALCTLHLAALELCSSS